MAATDSQVDRYMKFMRMSMEPEMLRALNYIIFRYDSASFEDYARAHPPGSQNFEDWIRVAAFYDFLGAMAERALVDRELVFETFPMLWGKMRPVALGMRETLRWSEMWAHFERLDAMEREYREAKSSGAKKKAGKRKR